MDKVIKFQECRVCGCQWKPGQGGYTDDCPDCAEDDKARKNYSDEDNHHSGQRHNIFGDPV